MVGFLVISGLALAGYGFARWRSFKGDRSGQFQRLLK